MAGSMLWEGDDTVSLVRCSRYCKHDHLLETEDEV